MNHQTLTLKVNDCRNFITKSKSSYRRLDLPCLPTYYSNTICYTRGFSPFCTQNVIDLLLPPGFLMLLLLLFQVYHGRSLTKWWVTPKQLWSIAQEHLKPSCCLAIWYHNRKRCDVNGNNPWAIPHTSAQLVECSLCMWGFCGFEPRPGSDQELKISSDCSLK